MQAFKLVDGQQRLITISLLLCAMREFIGQDSRVQKDIRKLLINLDDEGEYKYKIVPTEKYDDRSAYFAIVDREFAENFDSRIVEAYRYFRKKLAKINQRMSLDFERLFDCIMKNVVVVHTKFGRGKKPYRIFESLNAKGKSLSEPDKVRNYIAMRLPSTTQTKIYEKYWKPIEQKLQDRRNVSGIGELTAFLRHYISLDLGAPPQKSHVYARFRDIMEREHKSEEKFLEKLTQVHRFAMIYDKLLRPVNESNPQIRAQLHRLSELEISTAYPFVLYIYDLYDTNAISIADLLETLAAVENYMIRRFLVGAGTAGRHKMFPALAAEVDEANLAESTREELLYKEYPSDKRLRQSLLSSPLYEAKQSKRIAFVLETVNRRMSRNTGGHTVLDDDPTVEHIMSQSSVKKPPHHMSNLAEEERRDIVDNIGNLTLLTQKWNASLSDGPFDKKKTMLSQHALLINSSYFSREIPLWNWEAISRRAEHLAEHIIACWPAFGEPSALENVTGRKPELLTIMGEGFAVRSWRDVVFHMVDTTKELANDFDMLVMEFGPVFSREDVSNGSRHRQLSNGCWINVNVSGNDAVRLCEAITRFVGLGRDDWSITLREV